MITIQKVFYPMFKAGTTLADFDGKTWDALPPSDPDYDNQFVVCFVSGCQVLGRYPNNPSLWFTGRTYGEVHGSMGTLPVLNSGGGGEAWESARQTFVIATGEAMPEDWHAAMMMYMA